jgi:hypothetical protein
MSNTIGVLRSMDCLHSESTRVHPRWVRVAHLFSYLCCVFCLVRLINVYRENWRSNQEWTIQRHWQHWVHKIQDKDEPNKKHNTDNWTDEQPGPTVKWAVLLFVNCLLTRSRFECSSHTSLSTFHNNHSIVIAKLYGRHNDLLDRYEISISYIFSFLDHCQDFHLTLLTINLCKRQDYISYTCGKVWLVWFRYEKGVDDGFG